jgi:hypothetical protein
LLPTNVRLGGSAGRGDRQLEPAGPGAAGPAGHYTVLHPIARLDVSQVAAVKSTGRIKSC